MLGILPCRYEEMLEEALKAQNGTKYRGREKKTTRCRGRRVKTRNRQRAQ